MHDTASGRDAPEHEAALRPQLSVWQAVSVCVGMVIGAGIFKTTPLAATYVSSDLALLARWAGSMKARHRF